MKREEMEFEARIAEAVRAAAGGRRSGFTESQVETAAGTDAGASGKIEGAAAKLGELLLRLDALARPVASATQTGWQGMVTSWNPILAGLLRLFGGGQETAAVPPEAVRPAAARLDVGYRNGGDGYFQVDRDASGIVRAGFPVGAPAVVVNIDAIDSRSFLERTPEIAEAVKRVILEAEGMKELFGVWQE